MGSKTAIAWCDMTFNPWIGCTKVSAGCANCYAERDFDLRKHVAKWGAGQPRHRTSEANWRQPLKWDREAAEFSLLPAFTQGVAKYQKPRVFCASLADWLGDEVPVEWLADLLNLIRRTPHLDWLLLTKRPENWEQRILLAGCVRDSMPDGNAFGDWVRAWRGGVAPANVWVGTSIENQQTAYERIPALLKIPARLRFLSAEPLLGPVDLKGFRHCNVCVTDNCEVNGRPAGAICAQPIHWVICGGESGPKARPMHPDWARSLRDQCTAASVPFLFKQWGEWAPRELVEDTRQDSTLKFFPNLEMTFARVGKHVAGRLLDGREHNEFPEAREK